MTYESKRLFVVKGTHRTAMVQTGTAFAEGKYVVNFYYDGYADFEWKKGACGMSCEVCDTLEQAKRKARYYVSKD